MADSSGSGNIVSSSLTEIVLLLVFVFLLLAFFLSRRERNKVKECESNFAECKSKIVEINKIEGMLNLCKSQKDSLCLESLEETIKDAMILVPKGDVDSTELDEVIKSVEKLAELSGGLEDLVKELDASKSGSPKSLDEMAEMLAKILQELKRDAISKEIIFKQCINKGGKLPPCWADEKDRAIEYIYKVDIFEDWLRVEPIWPSYREPELNAIPSAQSIISDSMSYGRFRVHADPILKWSNKRECRHFIKVFDSIPIEKKDIYKKRFLFTVQDYFYTWTPRN